MEPEFFLFDFCPYCQRVRIVLQHLALPHRVVPMGASDRPAWFGEISPQKGVPAMRLGSVGLFDSSVITEYLDESVKAGMLPESPLERAVCRAWIGHAGFCQGLFMQMCTTVGEAAFVEARTRLVEGLRQIEQGPLSQGMPGFDGATLSLVDVAMAPLFTRMAHVATRVELLPSSGLERMVAWSQRLQGEPSVAASIPAQFPELFRRFLQNKAPEGHLTACFGAA